MNDTEKRLITDRVLEHSIFSNRPIYIWPKDEPEKKTSFFVEEILEDCFIAEISPENLDKVQQESLKDRELQVVIGYKKQAFVFPSKLVDYFKETPDPDEAKKKSTHFFFSKPHTGMLQNRRMNRLT